MNRAELLKHELQIQQARISQENKLRAERLDSAYGAVSDLNFLGFPPKELHKQIPESFLRGAYSHCKLPTVTLPTIYDALTPPAPTVPDANASPATPSAPIASNSTTKRSTIHRREQRKRKRTEKEQSQSNQKWDSEWVAPKVPALPKRVRFGDNTWRSKLLTNLDSSESESEPEEKFDKIEDIERAELEVKASVGQLHVEMKGQENHINQLEERLAKQRKVISEKQKLLRDTLSKYKEAVEELSDLTATHPPKRRKSSTEHEYLGEDCAKAKLESRNNDTKEELAASVTPGNNTQPNYSSCGDVSDPLHTTKVASDAYKLNSPLASFNSYRISELFVAKNPSRAYTRTYNSPFVKEGEICCAELGGKACQDETCGFVHFGDYDVPPQQVLTHILRNYVDSTIKKQFANELRALSNPNSEDMIVLLLNLMNQREE